MNILLKQLIVRKPQLRIVIFGIIVVSLFLLSNGLALQAATPIEVGYRDHSYPSGTGSNSEVTAEKPESKLWWNDGHWWASMWSTSGNAYHIYKLDWATQNWSDTGTQLDDRQDSRADVLWDGQKLYVVSHLWAGDGSAAPVGQRGELFRYSYNAGTYTLDAGFPVEVNDAETEALVLDKDSTGMLWVTYVKDSKVWVNHSQNNDDTDWADPYVLPVGGDANVDSDDLSSVVAYNGYIGVMWSSQTSGNKMFFAVHADGTDPTSWQSVAAYATSGDDHINLKSLQADTSGKVFAAVKTSQSAALLIVMVCHSGSCTSASDWAAYTAYTGADGGSPTRPAMLIDTSNRDLYIFARINDNIYYKRSDMDNVQFPSGWGEEFIISADDQKINDPTTTKQSVNSSTGLVVMASDRQKRHYFHNCIQLSGTSDVCLEAYPVPPTPAVFLSSAAYSVNEDGAPTATVTVNLNQSMPGSVTVDYTIQDDSATAGVDYTVANASGTLTFAPGQTSKDLTFAIMEDTLQEGDETVTITLSNAVGVDLGAPDTATLTIVDDDAPPAITFDSAAYTAHESSGNATVNVKLSHASDTAVTVQYATADGTAVAGSDYTAIPPTTMTFNPSETSKSFNVSLTDDGVLEPDETILLNLSNPSANATLGTPATATLTIVDSTEAGIHFSSATYSKGEGEGSALIIVKLSTAADQEVTVDYTTADNTATSGTDYQAQSGTLTFATGSTSQSFSVPIVDDSLPESSEFLDLTLSNPTGAILSAPSTATLTILDDDTLSEVTLDAATYDVVENGGGIVVTVNLNAASGQEVSVDYATADGTAVADSDYTPKANTLTFPPGITSQSFTVLVLNDSDNEGTESFTLALSNPQNATLGTPNSATVNINDDDTPPAVTFAAQEYATQENTSQVTITAKLSHPAAQTLTVDYSTTNGTAVAGEDYVATNDTLTFAPGVISQSFAVTIIDDSKNEDDETLTLSLSDASRTAPSTTAEATLTIHDNDRPTVQFSASDYSVSGGAGVAVVEVILSAAPETAVTVNYATSDGSAIAGTDYVATNGTLTFAPGVTNKTLTVPILVGTSNIIEKSFNLHLSDPTKADMGTLETAVLTILKNQVIYLPLLRG